MHKLISSMPKMPVFAGVLVASGIAVMVLLVKPKITQQIMSSRENSEWTKAWVDLVEKQKCDTDAVVTAAHA